MRCGALPSDLVPVQQNYIFQEMWLCFTALIKSQANLFGRISCFWLQRWKSTSRRLGTWGNTRVWRVWRTAFCETEEDLWSPTAGSTTQWVTTLTYMQFMNNGCYSGSQNPFNLVKIEVLEFKLIYVWLYTVSFLLFSLQLYDDQTLFLLELIKAHLHWWWLMFTIPFENNHLYFHTCVSQHLCKH